MKKQYLSTLFKYLANKITIIIVEYFFSFFYAIFILIKDENAI